MFTTVEYRTVYCQVRQLMVMWEQYLGSDATVAKLFLVLKEMEEATGIRQRLEKHLKKKVIVLQCTAGVENNILYDRNSYSLVVL